MEPFLRVVRGNPTAEEIAAVVITLLRRDGREEESRTQPQSAWADPVHVLRWHRYRGHHSPRASR
jgi:hypothetical protein